MVVSYGVTEEKMGAEAEIVCPPSSLDAKSSKEVLEILATSTQLNFVPTIHSSSFEDIGPRKSMEDDLSMHLGSLFRCPEPSSFHADAKSSKEVLENLATSTRLNFFPTIQSGSFADIGPRKSMEDEHIRIDDLSMHLGSLFRCPEPSAFYGIFDGHGGPEASAYIKENAMRFFFDDAVFPQSSQVDKIFIEDIENTFRKAFHQADLALADDESVSISVGTTALTVLIVGRLLVVANAGDCRAVLCRKGDAIEMSADHKPICPEERRRVEEMGGYIDGEYLNGVLSVTRALGDWEMKLPRGSPSPLISEPELRHIALTEDDEFLIIACDGIWDVITSQQAVDLVRLGLKRHNPDRCARELAMKALRLEAFDNLTAIVVCLANRDGFVAEEENPQPKRWRPRFRCSDTALNPMSFPGGSDTC